MKNKLLIVILFICLYFANCDVYAAGKDVQAVFKQSYNVDLVTDTINDGQISLNMDDLSIEITGQKFKNFAIIISAPVFLVPARADSCTDSATIFEVLSGAKSNT